MSRLGEYQERVKDELEKALKEEHTPRETAFSAALGTFVTVIPSLGLGVVFFLIISRIFDRINKLALFACVVVFNPVVKYPIYIVSYSIGTVLTRSSAPEEALEVALASQAVDATQTMIIGNLFLASVLSVVAYITVLKASKKYEDTGLDIGEELAEKI